MAHKHLHTSLCLTQVYISNKSRQKVSTVHEEKIMLQKHGTKTEATHSA